MIKYFFAIFRIIPSIIYCWFHFARVNRHKDKYSLDYRYKKIRKLAKTVYGGFNTEVHVEGLENLPNDHYVIYSNHRSMVDPALFIGHIDKPLAVVAKSELLKFPFTKHILTGIDCVFLDRNDLKASLKTMMKVQKDIESGAHNWLIFPEGTRNKDNFALLNEFHPGSFRCAMKAKAAIVPAALFGTNIFMSRKHSYKKYPVYMKILKPITYEEYKDLSSEEVAKLVQDQVQREISFNGRQYINSYMSKHYPNRYINK